MYDQILTLAIENSQASCMLLGSLELPLIFNALGGPETANYLSPFYTCASIQHTHQCTHLCYYWQKKYVCSNIFFLMVIIFSYLFYFRKIKAATTHLQHISEVRCAKIRVLCSVERHRSYPHQGEHARLRIPPQHHPWALVCLTTEQDFIGTRKFQRFCQMKTTLQVFKKEHVDFSERELKKKSHKETNWSV